MESLEDVLVPMELKYCERCALGWGTPWFGMARGSAWGLRFAKDDNEFRSYLFCEDGMSVKAVTKKKAKKASRKPSTKNAASKPVDVSVTHDKILHVIAEHAEAMTEANATEAEKGHLPAFKYLFELLGIYPAPAVKEPEAEDSNDLARVLLNRFDFPYKGTGDEEAAQGPKDGELVPAGVKDDSVE